MSGKHPVTDVPELSVGPFCVTRSNPTHPLTDPTQPTTSGKIWTKPNTTNNGAYGSVMAYFYTQYLSRTFTQPSPEIKFDCLVRATKSYLTVLLPSVL